MSEPAPPVDESDRCIDDVVAALRNDDAAELGRALRKCVAARSGVWLAEQLRGVLTRPDAPLLGPESALKLGGALRSALGPLAPSLPDSRRRASQYYVNVVGSSYVRAFGGVDLFFPLFIGMGPTMLLLTDEAAAVTYRKFQRNIERLDRRKDTILVLGGDPFYHLTNLAKTRSTDTPQITAEDIGMMRVVAERHRPLLRASREQISGRLMFLAATPTPSHSVNNLSARLNEMLKPICDDHGVAFLNWWPFLADRKTGKLRAEYCANAYPGDIHFSLEAASLFADLLRGQGLIPAESPAAGRFEWTHVFEASVDSSERTRIWSEPSVSPANAFQSHKIAASHLSGRVADILAALSLRQRRNRAVMVNVRDGHLAAALPAQLFDRCLALTDSPQNAQLGQVVLDFLGRSDVELRCFDDQAIKDMIGDNPDLLLLSMYPGTLEADEDRCSVVLDSLRSRPLTVIITPEPDRLSRLRLGKLEVTHRLPISNSHLPAEWKNFSVILAR